MVKSGTAYSWTWKRIILLFLVTDFLSALNRFLAMVSGCLWHVSSASFHFENRFYKHNYNRISRAPIHDYHHHHANWIYCSWLITQNWLISPAKIETITKSKLGINLKKGGCTSSYSLRTTMDVSKVLLKVKSSWPNKQSKQLFIFIH